MKNQSHYPPLNCTFKRFIGRPFLLVLLSTDPFSITQVICAMSLLNSAVRTKKGSHLRYSTMIPQQLQQSKDYSSTS